MDFSSYFWLLIWWMFFILYLIVLFQIIADIFRDHKLGGWGKALWIIALFIFPLISSLVYLIARGQGMNERQLEANQAAKQATDNYIRSVAPSVDPATQIANAKQLLDAGSITQAEFDKLKAKALA